MIQVEHLTKEFKIAKKERGLKGAFKSLFSNDYEIKKAVSNISFEISDGEIVGYIGANGAGKSTTIKMMTGILTPTSGNITVNGIIPYKDRQQNARDIGVVFGQRTQLWWDIPLIESYSILKKIYEVSDEDFTEMMNFFNDVLDLKDFINKPVRVLSLGQRMRADIAASILHKPKILYLDEPTIGLDVLVKEKVRNAIKLLNNKFSMTVVLTTHDLNDIEELCNRIIIIDKGSMLYDGNLTELKNKFGYITTLNIKLNKKIYSTFNLYKDLGLSTNDLIEEIQSDELIIKFNRTKITSSDIISILLTKVSIVDFSISETSLEDIIKKIYNCEV